MRQTVIESIEFVPLIQPSKACSTARLVEVGPVGERLGEELAVDVVLQAHEPLALRGRRADLVAAVDDRVGQQPTHRVAQHPLAHAVLDEGVVAEAEDEAHEVPVDERHAHARRPKRRAFLSV